MNDKDIDIGFREKLVELLGRVQQMGVIYRESQMDERYPTIEQIRNTEVASYLIDSGVTVQEWINSEEMLPEFPCLAIDVNGNSVFIPDGIITIKDKHGEWCINASLAKEISLIDGTKIDALIWENRIAYWMPIPHPPKGE